jgi:hypothetical protein
MAGDCTEATLLTIQKMRDTAWGVPHVARALCAITAAVYKMARG